MKNIVINPALKWLRKAAEEGDPEAQYDLAECYESGTGGVDRDPSQAYAWMQKAAKGGSKLAEWRLGWA